MWKSYNHDVATDCVYFMFSISVKYLNKSTLTLEISPEVQSLRPQFRLSLDVYALVVKSNCPTVVFITESVLRLLFQKSLKNYYGYNFASRKCSIGKKNSFCILVVSRK